MKPTWNIIGVLTWTAVLVGLILWLQHRNNEAIDSLQSALTEQSAQTTYWKTEAGKTVSSKPAAEIYPKNLENSYPELKKSLQDMKIQIRDLRAVLSATIEARGEGVLQVIHDTITAPAGRQAIDSLFIDDTYLRLGARITPGGVNTYSYTYTDSLTFAIHSKRKWFLGSETLYGDLMFQNPAAKALNQTSILIKKHDKRFVLSAGINYSIDGKLLPGVHVGYALIKL